MNESKYQGNLATLAVFTLEQLNEYLRNDLGNVDEKMVNFILDPYVQESRDLVAAAITKIAKIMQYITSSAVYTRDLEVGEGWYLDINQSGYIWTFTLTLERNVSEQECAKELIFRFSLAILEPAFKFDPEGGYTWPEFISKRDGVLTLESAKAILAFFKECHPKAEFQPSTEIPENAAEVMYPVGRSAKCGNVCYIAGILVNSDDFEWQLVEES